MRRIRRGALASGVLLLVSILAGCHSGPRYWSVDMVSVNPEGTDGLNDWEQYISAVSADGNVVAWTSRSAPAFGWPPTQSNTQVLARDMTSGETQLVSVNAAGTGGGNRGPFGWAGAHSPEVSPDGTKVLFASGSDDLVPTDPRPEHEDLFIRDLEAGTTTLLSSGAPCLSGDVTHGYFSPDGTKVAFSSYGAYVHDLTTGRTVLASPHVGGGCGPGGPENESYAGGSRFSADSTKLLVETTYTDLGPVDTNDSVDLYSFDLGTSTLSLVSANAAGTATANGETTGGFFSPDGTKVGFTTTANDMGPTDPGDVADAYVRDLTTGATVLASVNADGTGGGNAPTYFSGFSPDGTRVVMDSEANDLGPQDSRRSFGGDLRPQGDVYLRDLVAESTTLVSANADGTDSGSASSRPIPHGLVDGGTKLLFESQADNLGDVTDEPAYGGVEQIHMRDLVTGTTRLATMNAEGHASHAEPRSPRVSADGSTVVFGTSASDLGPPDSQSNPYLSPSPFDVYRLRFRGEADLSVVADAVPEPVPSGSELTYELQVANAGPGDAEAVKLGFVLAENTTLVSADPGCEPLGAAHPDVVVCDVGELDDGNDAAVTLTVRVDATGGSEVVATAVVSSDHLDLDGTDNVAHPRSTVTG